MFDYTTVAYRLRMVCCNDMSLTGMAKYFMGTCLLISHNSCVIKRTHMYQGVDSRFLQDWEGLGIPLLLTVLAKKDNEAQNNEYILGVLREFKNLWKQVG